MAVTKQGMMVRCPIKDIRQSGRNTQGVRLVRLNDKDTVSSVANIAAKDE